MDADAADDDTPRECGKEGRGASGRTKYVISPQGSARHGSRGSVGFLFFALRLGGDQAPVELGGSRQEQARAGKAK